MEAARQLAIQKAAYENTLVIKQLNKQAERKANKIIAAERAAAPVKAVVEKIVTEKAAVKNKA